MYMHTCIIYRAYIRIEKYFTFLIEMSNFSFARSNMQVIICFIGCFHSSKISVVRIILTILSRYVCCTHVASNFRSFVENKMSHRQFAESCFQIQLVVRLVNVLNNNIILGRSFLISENITFY